MDVSERKKTSAVAKFASSEFAEADWYSTGLITGHSEIINSHPRLLRSLSFGDPDYDSCVMEVLAEIFEEDPGTLVEVIDHFDIDHWYKQKYPEKHERIFGASTVRTPNYWKPARLRVFVSHLSSNKYRASWLKKSMEEYGVSVFLAHEDIEPSKEWRDEVEAGLASMDLLLAIVEPEFKESDWCAQEVGYALGRNVDVIPLRAGTDPFGFFGKYQGVQIKGKKPELVAQELLRLLLGKPKHRRKILQGMPGELSQMGSDKKLSLINEIADWNLLTNVELKNILEQSGLSEHEKNKLDLLIRKVDAFKVQQVALPTVEFDDDIPF